MTEPEPNDRARRKADEERQAKRADLEAKRKAAAEALEPLYARRRAIKDRIGELELEHNRASEPPAPKTPEQETAEALGYAAPAVHARAVAHIEADLANTDTELDDVAEKIAALEHVTGTAE